MATGLRATSRVAAAARPARTIPAATNFGAAASKRASARPAHAIIPSAEKSGAWRVFRSTEAPAREMNAPALERELPIEFFRRIAEFLKPGDANAIREMVERLEAENPSRRRPACQRIGAHASAIGCFDYSLRSDFPQGASQSGCEEGKRGEFPALAERIVRLANGHRLVRAPDF